MHVQSSPSRSRRIARAILFLLFLPVLPLSLIASWRARRRLRSYGPAAVLALHDLPRLRTR